MHLTRSRPIHTVEHKKQAFAIWITGLPASGKSTIAGALSRQLAARGIDAAVLESDALRQVLTPQSRYDETERDAFYRALVYIGVLLTIHGVPVIFDATANRRAYRDAARIQIPGFIEVFVDCPLQVCVGRDPKGIYRKAKEDGTGSVPGLQVPYEPPERPDVVIFGDREEPETAAQKIISALMEKQFMADERGS